MSIIKKIVEFMFYYKKKFIADSNLFDHQIFIKIKNHPLFNELELLLNLPIIELVKNTWKKFKNISQNKNSTLIKLISDIFIWIFLIICISFIKIIKFKLVAKKLKH